MARKLRVGVVFGGRSGEHDVSLRSAQTIMRAMDPDRFEIVPIGITREGRWLVGGDPLAALAASARLPLATGSTGDGAAISRAGSPTALDVADGSWTAGVDVLFPALHGPFGEDGTIQGMLELADVPYVGAGVLASALLMDKVVSRRLFQDAGLPLAPWTWVLRRDWEREPDAVRERIAQEIGFPCFVKPANLGSSVGVSKAHDQDELSAALTDAARYDRKIVIERGLNVRELEVSILGNDDPVASVVGEIVPANEYYDYHAKYVDDRSELHIPASITPEQAATVQALAIAAYRLADCAGMARADFFLDVDSGAILLNELNTIPGFTASSMYPRLWEASGLPLRDLVSRLIDLALERYGEHRDRD